MWLLDQFCPRQSQERQATEVGCRADEIEHWSNGIIVDGLDCPCLDRSGKATDVGEIYSSRDEILEFSTSLEEVVHISWRTKIEGTEAGGEGIEALKVFDWVSRMAEAGADGGRDYPSRQTVVTAEGRDWASTIVEGEGGEGRLLREDVEESLLRGRRGVQELE
jgi:hypothetical protein